LRRRSTPSSSATASATATTVSATDSRRLAMLRSDSM